MTHVHGVNEWTGLSQPKPPLRAGNVIVPQGKMWVNLTDRWGRGNRDVGKANTRFLPVADILVADTSGAPVSILQTEPSLSLGR